MRLIDADEMLVNELEAYMKTQGKCDALAAKINKVVHRQLSIFDTEPKRNMRVLVACEESQRVCIEFRRLGHETYSCDIEPCSGGHPEWHIQSDVLPLLNGNCSFKTVDGIEHRIDGKWDMIIAFPPCTYFSTAGANWLFRGGELNQERYTKGLEMKKLFMDIYNADCEKIAIENPTPMKIWELPKETQIIQPYQFGEPYTKRTQLWLKGLPLLESTKNVEPTARWVSAGYKGHSDNAVCKSSGSKKKRSTTFLGIAKAMAEQWGKTEEQPEPKYQKAPRYPWSYYGITKDRYKQLTEYIRSGRYASLASQAAHKANKDIAEYILLSVMKNKSYDELQKKWELREIERIPCCRTDFYGYRRYFYYLFNEKIKEIGK